MCRQVIAEPDVAVGAVAEVMAVDPDIGVVIDAVEFDRDRALTIRAIEPERLAIPSDPARRKPVRSAGCVLGEWTFDAPIVRQLHAPPGARIVKPELPVEVKRFARAERRFHFPSYCETPLAVVTR